ncbi:cache domain-containing protein [Marinibactrum halimedae]|uniref:Cache domain-containing protein n=1 Tax=Marinibactrum halimedae TaxID=1444977 RepID=A0AA37WN94_9GAMM|nr:cache domain-containing protein [Marinibactrum halimedae]MCD9460511.1 Cache 3/Cache 2 fusion domain-containing protein [Marinibactrum halimedae]GLS27874.1 hypothetical protein GCM10007877_35930 [Marinibactrum halimedae]
MTATIKPSGTHHKITSKFYWRILSKLCAVLSALAFISLLTNTYYTKQAIIKNRSDLLITQTSQVKDAISEKISIFQDLANDSAQHISEHSLSYQDAINYVKKTFEENKTFFSLLVAYTPESQPHISPLHAPYFERLYGVDKQHTFKNYTQNPDYTWYTRPLIEGAIWTEPYYDQESQALIVSYSTPIYRNKEDYTKKTNPIGVVPTDVGLDYLTNSIKKIQLGKTGYAMLFSEKGQLLAHPVEEFVTGRTTLKELSQQPQMSYLKEIDQCSASTTLPKTLFKINQPDNGIKYAICQKIPETGWLLVSIYSEEENIALNQPHTENNTNNAKKTFLLLSATLLVFSLSILSLISRQGIQTSTIYSAAFIVATINVWWAEFQYHDTSLPNATAIINKTDLQTFIRHYQSASDDKKFQTLLFVPTGVHIQSIEFRSASNVFITGYVWQKYNRKDIHEQGKDESTYTTDNNKKSNEKIVPGVVFPEAVSVNFNKVYQQKQQDDQVTFGWYFESELRQPFDYTKYPFDIQHFWLRMWHKEFYKNIILIPDTEGYGLLSPQKRPGVANDILLSGWNLMSSQFNFIPHSYNENFGIKSYEGLVDFPELYYDVILQRQFLTPFITQLLPIVVISFLLFASVATIHKSDVNEVRNSVGALLFIILLSHFSLREDLDLNGVVYLEYYYFVLYGLISILLYLNHSYFVTAKTPEEQKKLHKRFVIFFWPGYTGLIFITSLLTFI